MNRLLFSATAAAAISIAFGTAVAQEPTAQDDEIVVTGSPLARAEADALSGVSVVSGAELARSLAGTIGETLRREPGLSATSFGAGASRPIIRGQGGDRIRVLDNGIGSIDASQLSPDHAVAVEPALAERIEIIRGTGLLRYGSSAAGGVVNVRDGRLPDRVPENNIEGAGRATYSTVDQGSEYAGGLTFKAATIGSLALVLHGEATWRDAEDYDIPGFAESKILRDLEEEEGGEEGEEARDVLANSFTESQSAAFGASLIGDQGFLAIAGKQFDTTYGIPGGHGHEEGEEEGGEGEEEEAGVFIDLSQRRYDLNGRLDLEGAFEAIQIFAGTAEYTHTEFEGPGEVGTVFANDGWEARLELVQRTNGNWRGASGVQLQSRELEAIGEEAFVPPSQSGQWGIYTFQEWRRDRLQFEGAARFERTSHELADGTLERSFDGTSVSVGAGLDVTPTLSVGGTVFRTERAPTSEELYSNGPHIATGQFEIGNPDLDKETGTGIEGIVHFANERAHLTLTAFLTEYTDYIFDRNTGDEEDGLPVFELTPSDATFKGFELEGTFDIAELASFDIRTDVVFDLVEAELADDSFLPRIPPRGATVGLEGESAHLRLRAEAEWADDQEDIAEFELPTDGYTLINLSADFTPFPANAINGGLTFSLQANNLTDEEARQHTSFLKDTVPLPGRNVRFSIRYGF